MKLELKRALHYLVENLKYGTVNLDRTKFSKPNWSIFKGRILSHIDPKYM